MGGNGLPKWPGRGSIYLSLEEIGQVRPFCHKFDKERLWMYLVIMEKEGKMPIVKDKAIVLRGS